MDYGLTLLREGYSPGQGILVEMLLTLFFVMVFLHTTLERGFVVERKPIDGEGGGINNTSSQQYPVVSVTGANTVAPIVIGFALTACVMSRCVYVHVDIAITSIIVVTIMHTYNVMYYCLASWPLESAEVYTETVEHQSALVLCL